MNSTNSAIAWAFSEAKKWVAQWHVSYSKPLCICKAFDLVSANNLREMSALDDAQRIIRDRLGEFASIEQWLSANIEEYRNDPDMMRESNQIQDYRHRWLDSLIEEFSKE